MNCECTRFKTVMKRNSVRYIVACRACGKRVLVVAMHDVSGPVGKLP